MKAKNFGSNMNRRVTNGGNIARRYTTKVFNTIDGIRERADPILDKIEKGLYSNEATKVRSILATGESLHPSVQKLNLTGRYDTALANSKKALNISQSAVANMDKFMESKQLEDFRRMTGTGYGILPGRRLPNLPMLVNSKGPAPINHMRLQQKMRGRGIVQDMSRGMGQHGLSVYNSVRPYY